VVAAHKHRKHTVACSSSSAFYTTPWYSINLDAPRRIAAGYHGKTFLADCGIQSVDTDQFDWYIRDSAIAISRRA
jgi:hypothetical protein